MVARFVASSNVACGYTEYDSPRANPGPWTKLTPPPRLNHMATFFRSDPSLTDERCTQSFMVIMNIGSASGVTRERATIVSTLTAVSGVQVSPESDEVACIRLALGSG